MRRVVCPCSLFSRIRLSRLKALIIFTCLGATRRVHASVECEGGRGRGGPGRAVTTASRGCARTRGCVSFSLSVWLLEIRVLPTCTKLHCQRARGPAPLQNGSRNDLKITHLLSVFHVSVESQNSSRSWFVARQSYPYPCVPETKTVLPGAPKTVGGCR